MCACVCVFVSVLVSLCMHRPVVCPVLEVPLRIVSQLLGLCVCLCVFMYVCVRVEKHVCCVYVCVRVSDRCGRVRQEWVCVSVRVCVCLCLCGAHTRVHSAAADGNADSAAEWWLTAEAGHPQVAFMKAPLVLRHMWGVPLFFALDGDKK